MAMQTDLSSHIILPETKYHPELLVGMHRLGYNPHSVRIARRIGLRLKSTAREKNGHAYIDNIRWEEAIRLNFALGNFTFNPRQFVNFINLLKVGLDGDKRVYDGNGILIDRKKLEIVYKEICQRRDHWRAEWLDARFDADWVEDSEGDLVDVLHIEYDHRVVKGKLKPQKSEPLEKCLMKDRYINLYSDNYNRQGLPTRGLKRETKRYNAFYWYPTDDTFMIFRVDRYRADLLCYRVDEFTIPGVVEAGAPGKLQGLGIRAVRLR